MYQALEPTQDPSWILRYDGYNVIDAVLRDAWHRIDRAEQARLSGAGGLA